ncbi:MULTISPECIES: GNAT family N-acetyltransferase [unclassified Streptomyces]|uniref:GNAT family N-acetyltransferase n=1 Tax=unclassified Streptomyces TaxID=2593676 RepID=UPI002DD7BD23|nr:GNAT family N-acetyltransferase [Streptomyces sp. NBC_01775]WSB74468.1 GNAT family N-acetyltransferase [Streptomyces sp. NBC_01775]WSS45894.1 GNAT family N-acetyltransferase [Streptomyces sp. NBC_01187]
MSALRIRPARPEELERVVELWLEASRWLASRGSEQWQYPPRRGRMAEAVRNGECHLAFLDGHLAATVTLQEKGDPEWWADDDPTAALYVHDLTVRRPLAGQRIGARLLDWAGAEAGGRGKPWLRLEAWKTNRSLHRYYLGQGFELLRIVDLPHRNSGALFQRRSAMRTRPAGTPE